MFSGYWHLFGRGHSLALNQGANSCPTSDPLYFERSMKSSHRNTFYERLFANLLNERPDEGLNLFEFSMCLHPHGQKHLCSWQKVDSLGN